MKKITMLLAAFVVSGMGMAQSQRTVLAEEFTQASCGPCAAQNPTFNALLSANTAKVVSIKYQTSWPGVDPMNAQNPTDVSTRVSYYGVSGVPDGPMDGVEPTGASYTGAPANWSQPSIDAEYGVSSPFTIALSHTMSADWDSVFVTCVITASQAYTASGALKAHIAMVEKTITFNTAPGTNGETQFYNVMRKMYPSASGTTLPGTWTMGQTQTITFGVPIPSYIYSKSQICFVAFVQSDGDKHVQQAGMDATMTPPVDAGASALSGVPVYQCTTSFTPTVTVKNFGTTTLTSCTINYKIDAGSTMTMPWTGSLASGATTTATLPAVTATAGGHTLTTWTSAPNGGADLDAANDQTMKSFAIVSSTGAASPLVEGFVSTTFPPTGWFIDNPAGLTWTRKTGAGGFGTSTSCSKLDFYSIPPGDVDEFYAQNVDFTGTSTASMAFDVAYAQYASENDKLEVKVSSNCGTSWTTVYTKSGSTLMTASPTTSAFTPTASQWRKETVNLNAFAGQSNVMVKFVGTSAYGNNLYIDNINLVNNASAGVNEVNAVDNVTVYPNPIANAATINFNLSDASDVMIQMVNALGQVISTKNLGTLNAGEQTYSLDASNLDNGMYFVNIQVGNNKVVKKVAVNK
ncbi:MAG: T9SS type A sorting domain-containing protein [Bacteroidia bacterium]